MSPPDPINAVRADRYAFTGGHRFKARPLFRSNHPGALTSASLSPCPAFLLPPTAPSSTGASNPPLSATPIPNEDARFMVLLEKSPTFTEVLQDQIDRTREKHAAVAVATQNRPTKRSPSGTRGSLGGAHQDEENAPVWRPRTSVTLKTNDSGPPKRVKCLPCQRRETGLLPALVTGATLKDYQLEGVAWMPVGS